MESGTRRANAMMVSATRSCAPEQLTWRKMEKLKLQRRGGTPVWSRHSCVSTSGDCNKEGTIRTTRHRHHHPRPAHHLTRTMTWTERIFTPRMPQETIRPRKKGPVMEARVMTRDQRQGDKSTKCARNKPFRSTWQ